MNSRQRIGYESLQTMDTYRLRLNITSQIVTMWNGGTKKISSYLQLKRVMRMSAVLYAERDFFGGQMHLLVESL